MFRTIYRWKVDNLRFSIVKSVFLIRSYLIISSRPTGSAFFHKEKIQINAEAQVLACVDSSMICLFLNMHTVVQYNVDCLYMKTCEPQLLNLSSLFQVSCFMQTVAHRKRHWSCTWTWYLIIGYNSLRWFLGSLGLWCGLLFLAIEPLTFRIFMVLL
jgi:ABC-type transporter Mla MlaB component